MIYNNAVSPKEREFIDDLLAGEKYDLVYSYTDGDVTYYISSVDGELAIWSYGKQKQLQNIGEYYSVWVTGVQNTEMNFIKQVVKIAPLNQWKEATVDINNL